ncbi:hypothetical protein EX30DRAFT_344245 [Ascodesmis nigricans]|uniref:Uncharacterized protein n=1 Tax=Ascodesmis nigricans TaxID=341454 RepID=A0A4S2MJT1_9PEZI|nr:hypothetical protein EX30DRAFT_344245 [Ascodesmis nigricans]
MPIIFRQLTLRVDSPAAVYISDVEDQADNQQQRSYRPQHDADDDADGLTVGFRFAGRVAHVDIRVC